MSKFNFASVLSALTAGGASTNLIQSTLTGLAGASSGSTTATALLNQLVAEASDPVAVGDTITKIEQLPGIPAGVVAELGAIRAAGNTAGAVMTALPGLEAGINGMSTTSGFNLGGGLKF